MTNDQVCSGFRFWSLVYGHWSLFKKILKRGEPILCSDNNRKIGNIFCGEIHRQCSDGNAKKSTEELSGIFVRFISRCDECFLALFDACIFYLIHIEAVAIQFSAQFARKATLG